MVPSLPDWLHNTGDPHAIRLQEPRRALWLALTLALLSFAIYMANGRIMGQGDSWPSRYVPVSIVRHGHERVDDYPVLIELATLRVGERDGHYYSLLPKGPAYMAVPVYGLAELLRLGPSTAGEIDAMAKLSAAIAASVCVLIMTLNLAHLLTGWKLALLAGIYALGTPMWPVASQDLWTLTSAQLGGVLLIWCLMRSLHRPAWVLVAWLPLLWSLESRPSYIVVATVLALYTLVCYRKWALAVTGLGLLALVGVSLVQIGFVGPFYQYLMERGIRAIFTLDWGYLSFALARHLIDWSNGILVYSPFLLLFPVAMAILIADRMRTTRHREIPRYPLVLAAFGLTALGFLGLYSSFRSWRGGWSWTNRYALDGIPYAMMALSPLLLAMRWRRVVSCSLGFLGMVSIGLNGLVAFYADQQWLLTVLTDDRRIEAIPLEDSLLSYCWTEATSRGTSFLFDHYGFNRQRSLAPAEAYTANGELLPREKTKEARSHLGVGWSWTEKWGVWASLDSGFQIATIGPGIRTRDQAVLLVHVPERRDQRLMLDAMAYCDLAEHSSYQQSMEVWFNDHKLGDVIFPRCAGSDLQPATWSGEILAHWLTDGVDTITFRYAHHYGGDLAIPSRKLAVAFKSVILEPAGP
jgi:hypothetical protein